ncbi:calcium-dependent channel, putative phosphate domain-containing protein [Hirsutella rhossiliensis]|uniref:Calcium-dependent channel, putative phosphate domain-containing protein n=1 Tax=Hirsutella rhossiliensis TaxID=111463 RepID=A0A9P8SGC7_9HYPO|nr:calcium-dependent channel, putative phosphate domain-containing protein [Hirsutella rhossiliensis]KAH0960994.1 calcium-dependent channel, putative phosphate domain-containing protein [Hirsutella rhossiliensis]
MGSFISWINSNAGAATSGGQSPDENQPQSVSGMISTLIPVLALSLVYIAIFLFLRRSQRRYYAPRTYLGSLRHNERSPDLPSGFFNWIGTFSKLPDAHALTHQGLDAYLFLRYLRVAFTIGLVSLCITWPILFPVNATGMGGLSQLEILSYSNVSVERSPNRYYAHVFVGWAVYGFVMYMIMRECIFFINLRQAYMLTPHYTRRISARTVLFTTVPNNYLDEARIRQMFNNSVRHVWIAGKADKLDEMVEERDKVAMKLEGAEVKLIKMVNKARAKAAKKGGAAPNAGNDHDDAETGNIAARYVPDKKRPSHRLGPLGLVGKKVDTIEWSRSELQRLVPATEQAQAEWSAGNYDKVNAVFVEFHTQSDAQAAFQVLTHHKALHMCPKTVGIKPQEVVWKNLSIPWWQLVIRRYVIYAFVAALIIFWAIPVAIVGLIAQVNTLKSLPGLTWIDKIPPTILGVVSGLLPSVALAILMSYVPIIMRGCAKLAGAPTLSQAELFTQNAYFVFQVVQVFLIRTVFDSASTVIVQIAKDPSSVFTILGSQLPTSSNFYISYFILQGITIATGVLTQVVGFFIFKLLYKFLAGTPRAMYAKWTTLSAILWGSLLPVFTNIICISLIYSVIAPLMLFWSTLAMALFYLAFRYNIFFVSETAVDTQGLIYPRALKQLFVGVYLAEICMVGLFAVSKAIGPAILMAAFLVFTILFNITMSKNLDPLLYGLPRSVQAQEQAIRAGDVESTDAGKDTNGAHGNSAGLATSNSGESGVVKKGNFIARFFMPWKYADYATLRSLVPREDDMDFEQQYSDEVEATAFLPPSVTSKTPTLWIPEDPAGVSKQEVALTSKVIPITDEGATLDEKNNITWDTEGARPPIWVEKVYY